MKYKFAGQTFNTLKQLREALNDSARLSDEAIAREVIRIFETTAIKNDLLDWLDWQDEATIVSKLEKARSPRMFSTFLLGEDSPRLERIDGVIGSLMEEDRQNAVAAPVRSTSLELATPKAPLPLYKVVDLTDWSISRLDAVPSGGWTDEYKTTKLVLRRIDAGEFQMGSPSDEPERYDYETLHRVVLTRPFYVGVFAVTQQQWKLVDGSAPSRFKGALRPVERVSYNDIRGAMDGARWPVSSAVDADSFLGKLRARIGCTEFDLPTEAQWEYACRAGTTKPFFWGKMLNGDLANCDGNKPYGTSEIGRCRPETCDVGLYAPNPWGLYDMHGNVWEWCLDWWGSYDGNAVDPQGSASSNCRVCRGGSWGNCASICRAAYRLFSKPGEISSGYGFRLCCSADDAE